MSGGSSPASPSSPSRVSFKVFAAAVQEDIHLLKANVKDIRDKLRFNQKPTAEEVAQALSIGGTINPSALALVEAVRAELMSGLADLAMDGNTVVLTRSRFRIDVFCRGMRLVKTHTSDASHDSVRRTPGADMSVMQLKSMRDPKKLAELGLEDLGQLRDVVLKHVSHCGMERSNRAMRDERIPRCRVVVDMTTVTARISGHVHDELRLLGLPYGSSFSVVRQKATSLWSWQRAEAVSLALPKAVPLQDLLGDRLGGEGLAWLTERVLEVEEDGPVVGHWLRCPRFSRDAMLVLVSGHDSPGHQPTVPRPPRLLLLSPHGADRIRADAEAASSAQLVLKTAAAAPVTGDPVEQPPFGGRWAALELSVPTFCWGRNCRVGEDTIQTLSDLVRAGYRSQGSVEAEYASARKLHSSTHSDLGSEADKRDAEIRRQAGEVALDLLQHLASPSGPLAALRNQAEDGSEVGSRSHTSQTGFSDFACEEATEEDDDIDLLRSVDLQAFADELRKRDPLPGNVALLISGGPYQCEPAPVEALLDAVKELQKTIQRVSETDHYQAHPWIVPFGGGKAHGSLDGGNALVGGLGQLWLTGFEAGRYKRHGNPIYDVAYLAASLLLQDCLLPVALADLLVLVFELGADAATAAAWLRADQNEVLDLLTAAARACGMSAVSFGGQRSVCAQASPANDPSSSPEVESASPPQASGTHDETPRPPPHRVATLPLESPQEQQPSARPRRASADNPASTPRPGSRRLASGFGTRQPEGKVDLLRKKLDHLEAQNLSIPPGLAVLSLRSEAKREQKRADMLSKAWAAAFPALFWKHAAAAVGAAATGPNAALPMTPGPSNEAAMEQSQLAGSMKWAWNLQEALFAGAARWMWAGPQDPLLPGASRRDCEAAAAFAGLLPQLAAVWALLVGGGGTEGDSGRGEPELAPWQRLWALRHATAICRRLAAVLEEYLGHQGSSSSVFRRRSSAKKDGATAAAATAGGGGGVTPTSSEKQPPGGMPLGELEMLAKQTLALTVGTVRFAPGHRLLAAATARTAGASAGASVAAMSRSVSRRPSPHGRSSSHTSGGGDGGAASAFVPMTSSRSDHGRWALAGASPGMAHHGSDPRGGGRATPLGRLGALYQATHDACGITGATAGGHVDVDLAALSAGGASIAGAGLEQLLDHALATGDAVPMVGWPCPEAGASAVRASRQPLEITETSQGPNGAGSHDPEGGDGVGSPKEYQVEEQAVQATRSGEEGRRGRESDHESTPAALRRLCLEQAVELSNKSDRVYHGCVLHLCGVLGSNIPVELVKRVQSTPNKAAEQFDFSVCGAKGQGLAVLAGRVDEFQLKSARDLEVLLPPNDFVQRCMQSHWSFTSSHVDMFVKGEGAKEAFPELNRILDLATRNGHDSLFPGVLACLAYTVQICTTPLFAPVLPQELGGKDAAAVFVEVMVSDAKPHQNTTVAARASVVGGFSSARPSVARKAPSEWLPAQLTPFAIVSRLKLTFRPSPVVWMLRVGARIRLLCADGATQEPDPLENRGRPLTMVLGHTPQVQSNRPARLPGLGSAGIGGVVESLKEDGRYTVRLDPSSASGPQHPSLVAFDPSEHNFEFAGVFRYAVGQALVVHTETSARGGTMRREWRNASVVSLSDSSPCMHTVRLKETAILPEEDLTLSLGEANHTPAWLSSETFEQLAHRHRRSIRAMFGFLTEPLTNRSLDVLTQAFSVVFRGGGLDAWKTLLLAVTPPGARAVGGLEGRGFLVWGEVSWGKTSLARRLACECVQVADGLLPIIISAAGLAKQIAADPPPPAAFSRQVLGTAVSRQISGTPFSRQVSGRATVFSRQTSPGPGLGLAALQASPVGGFGRRGKDRWSPDPLDMLLRETFSCEDEKDPASEPYLFWRQALYSRRAAIIVDSDEVLAEEAWPAVYTWCCRLADAGHKLVLFARPEVRESLQSVLSGPDKAAVPPPTRLVELEIGPLPQPLQRAMAAARLGDELAEPFMRSFAGCEVITQHPYGLSVLLAVAERDGTEDKQRLPIDVMNLAAGAVLESTLKIGPKEREQCLAVLEVVALEIERQRPRDCVSSASILDVLHLEQPHLARLWGQLRDPICLGKTVLVQPGRPLPGEGPTIRFINSVFKDYFLARCYVRYTENGHFLGLPPFESMLMDPRWDTFFGYMLPIAELSELPFTVDVQSQSLDAAQVRQLVRHFSAWTQPLLRLVFGRGHVCDFSLLRDVLRDSGHTLQHLALRCNALGTPGAEVLAEWLRGETAQVWSLDLAHCSLGPEGVEALAAVLGGNKVLRDLDLSSNILRPEGAASLGEALRQNSAIERLHVDSNSLGGPGLVQLLSALRHNASLMLLSAASNRVGNDGAAAVAAALADGSAGEVLEELDLRNNEITGLGLQRLAGSLGARGALPSLRRLELAGNEIGPGGAFHLAAPLATISIGAPLTCLGLDHCMVTAEGAQSLARALAEGAACLSSVDLRGNRLGSAGARLLAAGMDTGKCKLRRLSIPGNGIGDEGTAALVAGMPGSLEELDLSENRIGAAGAQALARALLRPERNFLRSVWLVRNMLGPTGCEALAAVLGKRSRVENLQLAGNAVANAGAKAMAEALHRKPRRLAVLGLQSNHISASGIDALSKAAEQAPALERLCVEGNSAGEEWDPYLDNLIGAQTRLAATTRIQAAAAASAAAAAAEAAAAEDVEAAAASKEEDDGSSGLDAGSSLGSRLGGPAPRARGGRRGTVMQAAERRGSYVLLSEEVARRWSRLYQALTEAYAASPPPTTDAAATAVERRRRTVAVAASALRSGRMASK